MMYRGSFSVLVLRSVKARKAYGTALLAVGLAFACTYLAVPLAERAQLFLLLAAVVVSSWYGGLGPGLLATAVAVVGHAALIKAPSGDDLVRILLFVLVGGAISALAAGRRRAEDRARAGAREQAARRDAAALSAVGQALVQSLDTESVGRHIAEAIRVLLGGTLSVLWELEPTTNRLVAVATSGSGSPFPPGTRIPQNEALAGFAVSQGRPVSTSNILTDPRLTLAPATRALVEQSGHGSVLAVPLMIGGRVTGVLAVGDVTGRAF